MDDISDLHVIPAPDGVKDISEAHIQGKDIPCYLEELKAKSLSVKEIIMQQAEKQSQQLYQEAKEVIEADDPFETVKNAIINLGYGGDINPALVTYLAATSRLLLIRHGTMPVHLLLSGSSSCGKSYTVSLIKKLLPSEAFHVIDAGSPHVLIYDEASLKHRALIFSEADSLPSGEDNPAASAIRNLLQDHYLHYAVTVRDAKTGNFTVKEIDKPGPTVMITTSTKSMGELCIRQTDNAKEG